MCGQVRKFIGVDPLRGTIRRRLHPPLLMPIRFSTEHRHTYCVVRVEGEPTLAEFLDFIERLGVEASKWQERRALVDLRAVRTLTTAQEHRAVGHAVACHLAALERLASVVPADRLTRNSEEVANASGANLRVFTGEGEALTWLRGPSGGQTS